VDTDRDSVDPDSMDRDSMVVDSDRVSHLRGRAAAVSACPLHPLLRAVLGAAAVVDA
jgi:hypothetical protein